MKTDNVIKLEIGACDYDTTKVKKLLDVKSEITLNMYIILIIRVKRLIQLDYKPELISIYNMADKHSSGHTVYNVDFFNVRWVLSLKLICF